MRALPEPRSRRLLWIAVAGLFVVLAVVGWMARPQHEPASVSVAPSAPEARREASAPQPSSPARVEPATAERAEAPVAPPPDGTRVELARDHGQLFDVELLIRRRDDETPIPRCELLYLDGDEELQTEIRSLVLRKGLDLAEVRRTMARTTSDEQGRVRLRCEAGTLIVLALSPTHWGDDVLEVEANGDRRLTIDCDPMQLVRARVVDPAGHPRAGVRVLAFKEQKGLIDFPVTGTTRAPDGLVELGPLHFEDGSTWVLSIAGAFPRSASVTFDLAAHPDPIDITLPEHGAVEVRLAHQGGQAFAGDAVVELECVDDGVELAAPSRETMAIGTGRVVYARVALGLELRARARVQGLDFAFEAQGHGPRSAGEKAVIELKLDKPVPVLTGRAIDGDGRALRYRQLELRAAVELGGETRQISEALTSDATGRFALALGNCAAPTGTAALLLVDTSEKRPLGGFASVALHVGNNELGNWTLVPPKRLASGRVVDAAGAPSPARSVELVETERPLGLGFALAAESDGLGEFELRGWSSETSISILAGSRGSKLRAPITVEQGARDVVLPLAPEKTRKP